MHAKLKQAVIKRNLNLSDAFQFQWDSGYWIIPQFPLQRVAQHMMGFDMLLIGSNTGHISRSNRQLTLIAPTANETKAYSSVTLKLNRQ